jgi:hypothetical protein
MRGREGQRGHDPEGDLACLVVAGEGPRDGGLQVVVLGANKVLPVELQGAEQFGPGLFGERRVVLREPARQQV